jgi:hypothetical protein
MKALAIAVGLCVASAGAAFAVEGTTKSTDQFKALAQVQKATQLTEGQLATIEGQAITTQTTNPGGQSPQGGGATSGQAIQTTAVNPAGHAPGGHN